MKWFDISKLDLFDIKFLIMRCLVDGMPHYNDEYTIMMKTGKGWIYE